MVGAVPTQEEGGLDSGHGGSDRSARSVRWSLLVVVVLTLAAFGPVSENGFVNWDDPQNLVHNEHFRGLGVDNLHWMFTARHGGHYHPLTWLSFTLDYYLWKARPAGVHLTSLLLHAATAALFFLIARRLLSIALRRGPDRSVTIGALAAAVLFAVHPLRTESVAWATERRDVLCGFWLALTVLLYLRGATANTARRRRGSLAASWGCYVLSLLSKASGIVLPVVLLVIDVYPLKRWRRGSRGTGGRVIAEKLVFAVPALIAAVMAAGAQAGAGAMWSLSEHPLGLRIGQAFYGILFYLSKTVWPSKLAALYEQSPDATAWDWSYVASAVVVVGVSAGLWFMRRRVPATVAAWCAYVVLLAPTLGLVQSGPQVVADRYSYFSCMPLAILAGGGIAAAWRRLAPSRRAALGVALASCALTLVLLTRAQVRLWKDSVTLWTSVIERGGSRGIAHANLATALNDRGEYRSACEEARKALDTLPGNRTALFALGRCSAAQGELVLAEECFTEALDIAKTVGKTGSSEMVALADVKIGLGKFAEAEQLYRSLIAAEPSEPTWQALFADFLASRGRWDEARDLLERALVDHPRSGVLRSRLAAALVQLDDVAGAIRVLEAGIGSRETDAVLLARLAWILATTTHDELRNGAKALSLARRAVDATGSTEPFALEALAAAQAETGDFDAAQATLRSIRAISAGQLPPGMEKRIETRLAEYARHEPHRE